VNLEPDVVEFLRRSGLVAPDEQPDCERLPGGVSSDIWAVRTRAARIFCVKRALPRLRVTAEWLADPARNATEVRWLTRVAQVNPNAAPKVLASDAALGLFAMEYLPPSEYELWKARLARGEVSTDTAVAVGRQLAAIHSSFARSSTAPADFDTGAAFHSLRLEPYLLATARAHQDLAPVLESLARRTASTKSTVVHGDVSPKNILIGPRGPVFLDAECAWFGDPAFDLAFCLNHLLLKTVWVPPAKSALLEAFDALAAAYLTNVDWEAASAVNERAGSLLPGLLLARIDGKSPVEYLQDDPSKDLVRQKARAMLRDLPQSVGDVRGRWSDRRSGDRRTPRAGGVSIDQVIGRRVWDSRGRPTVEAEVVLSNGARGRAIAPAGASTGSGEAVDLRDGGPLLAGLGVDRAVRHVSEVIADGLHGLPAMNQHAIDARLVELDGTTQKARLGGNAIVAVSMAALHAAAASAGEPLWRYVAAVSGNAPVLPMPMVQIFGGGAHAGRRIDIQDFLIIPVAATTFDRAMTMTAEVYAEAGRIMAARGTLHGVADEGGWWPEFSSNREALDTLESAIERAGFKPGDEVAIAIDVAASQLRNGSRYVLASERRELSSDELVELFLTWCRDYPIISVEDPVAEDDAEGMRAFTARAGQRLQVIGDDYLVTSAARVSAAARAGACNAVLLKPNQAGTVTETAEALAAARAAGWTAVVSARSGETEDVTIVHLAVGWGAGQLKVGSFARGERTVKWNEALRIEEALAGKATFGEPRLPKASHRG
jgi:enolase